MKRMYVIICDINDSGATCIEDVVSSLTKAEELCFQYEDENPENIYYWQEVISSED